MKKLVLIILCIVLLLSGCQTKQKAEAFYTETTDTVVFETEYDYYFTDEPNIFCHWVNLGDENIFFHDTFELHELGDNGEWYRLGNLEDASFNVDYKHFVEPGEENLSNARYGIDVFTNKLEEGKTYRISTYCFDADENYYQVYAEFTCDSNLAEKEMLEITDGMFGDRDYDFETEEFEVLPKKD